MLNTTTKAPEVPVRQFIDETKLEELTGVKARVWKRRRLRGEPGPRWFKLAGAARYDIREVLAWIESCARGGQSSTLGKTRKSA